MPGGLNTTEIAYEHLHRYALAALLVQGKTVLDLASGEGYGAALLAKHAARVVGVEIDPEAVHHASSQYTQNGLSFVVGSITHIPLQMDHAFDVITCFEAFEHIARQDLLLSEVKRLLKPGGLFIVSTPNKLVYTDLSGEVNPFHVREFYRDEYEKILQDNFVHVRLFGQQVLSTSQLWAEQHGHTRSAQDFFIKRAQGEFVWTDGHARPTKHFLAVCSDGELPDMPTASTLSDVDDHRYNEVVTAMKNSMTAYDAASTAFHEASKQADHHTQVANQLLAQVEGLTKEVSRHATQAEVYSQELLNIKNSRTYKLTRLLLRVKRLIWR